MMSSRTIETRTAKIGNGLTASVSHIRLHTPELGSWNVFECTIREGSAFVETINYPESNVLLTFDDVFSQLEYTFDPELCR